MGNDVGTMLIEGLSGFTDEEINDQQFKRSCCFGFINNIIPGSCGMYYERRPIGTCHSYQTPISCKLNFVHVLPHAFNILNVL